MPTYPYYPATYQPIYQNPYMQQQQQPQPQTSGIIWVSNESEADAYPIAPNNAVTLWNRTLPVVYVKQADASGRPNMKVYDLVERRVDAQAKQNESVPDYVTKDDLKALEASVQSLKNEMKAVRRELKKKEDDDE